MTRQLTEEEIAELQLEQGYVDRALQIYEELARRDPSNASYATRRAWLARMAAAQPAPVAREASPAASEPDAPPARPSPEPTLRGVGPVELQHASATVRAMRIVRVAGR